MTRATFGRLVGAVLHPLMTWMMFVYDQDNEGAPYHRWAPRVVIVGGGLVLAVASLLWHVDLAGHVRRARGVRFLWALALLITVPAHLMLWSIGWSWLGHGR